MRTAIAMAGLFFMVGLSGMISLIMRGLLAVSNWTARCTERLDTWGWGVSRD